MPVALNPLPDLSALDVSALRELVLAQHEQLRSRETEIENLKLLILKLKRLQFGRKSEKLDRQIEQLELQLEDLEASAPSAPPAAQTPDTPGPAHRPARKPLPERLPRETRTYAPKHDQCPDCGGALRLLGEDVTEILEYVPARFKVIRKRPAKAALTTGRDRFTELLRVPAGGGSTAAVPLSD